MLPGIRRHSLEVQLAEGKITQQLFNEKCLISPIMVLHATAERIASWVQTFEVKNEAKLLTRRYWHSGHVELLFNAKDPTGEDFHGYEMLCHATHVSPMAPRLSTQGQAELAPIS